MSRRQSASAFEREKRSGEERRGMVRRKGWEGEGSNEVKMGTRSEQEAMLNLVCEEASERRLIHYWESASHVLGNLPTNSPSESSTWRYLFNETFRVASRNDRRPPYFFTLREQIVYAFVLKTTTISTSTIHSTPGIRGTSVLHFWRKTGT